MPTRKKRARFGKRREESEHMYKEGGLYFRGGLLLITVMTERGSALKT